jgi:hypothetical protein
VSTQSFVARQEYEFQDRWETDGPTDEEYLCGHPSVGVSVLGLPSTVPVLVLGVPYEGIGCITGPKLSGKFGPRSGPEKFWAAQRTK